jgi:hypothetical protein
VLELEKNLLGVEVDVFAGVVINRQCFGPGGLDLFLGAYAIQLLPQREQTLGEVGGGASLGGHVRSIVVVSSRGLARRDWHRLYELLARVAP